MRPITAINEMGVAIDEAGRNQAPCAIDHLLGVVMREIGFRADIGYAAILARDGTVHDETEPRFTFV